MSIVGIMQPYFFPYLGYWQLINAVDHFVVYDDIKYTKKGWINRNYYLLNGERKLFSVNIEKASDCLDIRERRLSSEYKRDKLISKLRVAYHKAPMYVETFSLIADIIRFPSKNLFEYIYNSIVQICSYLDLKAKIIVSSSLAIDSSLKSAERVISFCQALDAHRYINAIGGRDLYSASNFAEKNITLQFIQARRVEYEQWDGNFVPCLSIIDLMMFNSKEQLAQILMKYDLLDGV